MEITILEKLQNADSGPLIVAELSGNHGGDLDKALKLVESAVDAGADAIKLQTYKPETITVNSKDDRFLIKKGLWTGKYLHDLYSMAMTPWEWHRPLAEKAKELGSVLFSSPFDETAVGFLEKTIEPILYKVASFEVTDLVLLKTIAATKKPVIMSTGMANINEIEEAVETLRLNGTTELADWAKDVSEFKSQAISSLIFHSRSKIVDAAVFLKGVRPGHSPESSSSCFRRFERVRSWGDRGNSGATRTWSRRKAQLELQKKVPLFPFRDWACDSMR